MSNLRGSYSIIVLIVVSLFFGANSAFGQIQDSIVVTTDKSSYSEGETILITGEVRDLYSGTPVSVIVLHPDGSIVSLSQLTVGADKKFSTELSAGGSLMDIAGMYTVVATYGNASRSAETTFSYEEISITVFTNSSIYGNGAEVTVYGNIKNYDSSSVQRLTFLVLSPDNNTVTIGQILPSSNGLYEFTFTAGGNLWKLNGDYTIQARYGADTSETTINYVGGELVISPEPEPTPYPQPTYDTTPPKILKPTDITVNAKNQNGAVVTFDVLAIDDTDDIVNTTCSPSSSSFFQLGDTRVVCNARDSSGNRAIPISFNITVNAPGSVIPEWVKNVAAFWCDNKIDDTSFIEGIQYLIDNNIITVSVADSNSGFIQDIPQWVQNNACWWSKDLITDKEFASGIEFLVKAGIIRV